MGFQETGGCILSMDEMLEKISIVLAEWEGIKQSNNITDDIIEYGKEILNENNKP
jgi:hypothetical protein